MSTETSDRSYRVLARKYRPSVFAELIGQDALVRTLSNAIEADRLAHAYLLTVCAASARRRRRGSWSARSTASAPTARVARRFRPCGVCEHCVSIAEDRHVDVLEMDAASRTGVDDIRELIEGRALPAVSARYKIYIIDEVHMLSRNAFNALLKTLEEPPPHVKFIFATTRYAQGAGHRRVALSALRPAARRRRAAGWPPRGNFGQGSGDCRAIGARADCPRGRRLVRDALSILDQAIAHAGSTISESQVADMLGLADRIQVFDLFESVMAGEIRARSTRWPGSMPPASTRSSCSRTSWS